MRFERRDSLECGSFFSNSHKQQNVVGNLALHVLIVLDLCLGASLYSVPAIAQDNLGTELLWCQY
jgi:hypothetical protein